MSLADNAFDLLAYLIAQRGGEVSEVMILVTTKMDRDDLVAARCDLVKRKLIIYTPGDGVRPAKYLVTMSKKSGQGGGKS